MAVTNKQLLDPAGKNRTNTTHTLPTPVHVRPVYPSYGQSPYVATFREVINSDGQSHCSQKKRLLTQSTARRLRDFSSSTAAITDELSSRIRHLDHSHTLKAVRRALAADEHAATATAHDFLAIDACFPTDDYLRRDLLDIKRHLKGLARRRLEAAIDTACADLLPPPIGAARERCEGEEECEEMEEDRRGR
jgi:hypothetical protein